MISSSYLIHNASAHFVLSKNLPCFHGLRLGGIRHNSLSAFLNIATAWDDSYSKAYHIQRSRISTNFASQCDFKSPRSYVPSPTTHPIQLIRRLRLARASKELGDNGRRRGSILGLVIGGGATATAREGTKACSGKERLRMSFFSHAFGVPSFCDERRGREENVTHLKSNANSKKTYEHFGFVHRHVNDINFQ